MINERAVQYLRANLNKYPLEALKGVLLKGGITPAEIEQALIVVNGPPAAVAFQAAVKAVPEPQAPNAAPPTATSIFTQSKAVLVKPAEFFRSMPRSGGYKDPAVFMMIMIATAQAISLVFSVINQAAGLAHTPMGGFGIAALVALIVGTAFSLAFFPLVLLIGAGITHFVWTFIGSKQPFEASFRCLAYMSPIAVVQAVAHAVPVIGMWMAIPVALYGVYLLIPASIEVHGIEKKKAVTVFAAFGLITALASISSVYGAWRLQQMMKAAAQAPVAIISQQYDERTGK